MNGDPDEDLVRRVAAGDALAMRMMISAKLPRLLALATRMLGDASEAEDVAQETFVRIWQNASRWRRKEARFDTWIHRVAVNLCYDRLRRRQEVSMPDVPDTSDTGAMPDAGLLEEDSPGRKIEQALQALVPRQREAIVLVYYQVMSNIEAAAVMGISVDALESLLSRGRRSLRIILMKERAND